MNLSEYTAATQQVFDQVLHRIEGVGADQYASGDTQRFEGRDLAAITQDTLEELEDAIAYLAQLHIRLSARLGNGAH